MSLPITRALQKNRYPEHMLLAFSSNTVTFNLRAWAERYEDWVQVRGDLSVAVDEVTGKAPIFPDAV